jgi:hypothetical protein
MQFGFMFLGTMKGQIERKSDGWCDFNHVMYRNGQVLFKTKDKRWIITGAKMSSTQFKRQIEQQILDMERRKQDNQKS